MHGSCSEMVAMGINPTELLGLITHKEGEEEKDQFLIKEDDPVPDDEGIHSLSLLNLWLLGITNCLFVPYHISRKIWQ